MLDSWITVLFLQISYFYCFILFLPIEKAPYSCERNVESSLSQYGSNPDGQFYWRWLWKSLMVRQTLDFISSSQTSSILLIIQLFKRKKSVTPTAFPDSKTSILKSNTMYIGNTHKLHLHTYMQPERCITSRLSADSSVSQMMVHFTQIEFIKKLGYINSRNSHFYLFLLYNEIWGLSRAACGFHFSRKWHAF